MVPARDRGFGERGKSDGCAPGIVGAAARRKTEFQNLFKVSDTLYPKRPADRRGAAQS